MRKILLTITVFLAVTACKVNPFTGKKMLNFYPNSQIFPMAFAQYDQFLTENKVVEGTADARMITRVG
ncbi:MAG: M48 family peptidase, partial [Flavobacteriaceae bacterium]